MKKIFSISIASLLCISPLNAETSYSVKVYIDKDSAGWAYKANDHAFVVENKGCKIKWNATEGKDGRRTLEVRRNCNLPFIEQIAIHRAILDQINQRWRINKFESIYWGPLCGKWDWSWCIPIAKASIKSEDYIDYWRHYPDSKLKSINSLFVELANQTNSYSRFADLLYEFGVKLKLQGVEKVFETRLKNAPFYKQLTGLNKSDNPKVMYNVGTAHFLIVK